jgi:hypothetical protein
MKKGKVNRMPTNPEAQIRTRARYLPIDRCRINVNWRESHLASVVITRKHVNGNISFAFCLVDLLLLGVKDCLFDFNILPEKLNEWLDEMEVDFEDCEYALAHNIVFESIDFAKEWGFRTGEELRENGDVSAGRRFGRYSPDGCSPGTEWCPDNVC